MPSKNKKAIKAKRSLKKTAPHKKPVKINPLYIKIPGKARRYKNTKTGATLSRRQYEKINPPVPIIKRLGLKQAKARIKKNREDNARYSRLVQDYIRARKRDGLTTTKRGVRNSASFKQIVRDLKSKNPQRKADALYETGRIEKEEIAKYVEMFENESGGIKLNRIWVVKSKSTNKIVWSGAYRECVRWLARGTRRKNFYLSPADIEEEEGEEE